MHRRSETLFEEIHARIRSSFEAANSEALAKFDQQIQSLVAPHIQQTDEAIHRLAGGRSLLDAAMTMQQDRIRNSADDAFAESLGRFRENLGSVEQMLNESSHTITSRHLEELENKATDLKHHVGGRDVQVGRMVRKENADTTAKSDGKIGGTMPGNNCGKKPVKFPACSPTN